MSPFNELLKDLSSKTVTDFNYVWLKGGKQTNASRICWESLLSKHFTSFVLNAQKPICTRKNRFDYIMLGDLPERDLEELVSLLGESGHGLLPS